MSFQIGNLAFSLIVTIGITGLSLIVAGWLVYRFTKPYFSSWGLAPNNVRKIAWVIWIIIMAMLLWPTIQSNAPRITLDDYSKQPSYSQGTVKNLNPNTLSDDERVEQNRKLIERNVIK